MYNLSPRIIYCFWEKILNLNEQNYKSEFININLYKSIETYWIKLNNEQKGNDHWNKKVN